MQERGVGRPSNPHRKQRINVTFSPDTLAELEKRIPEKQRSAFLEALVRREFDMSSKGKQPMQYNPEIDAYTGISSEGRTVQVEGVEWLESQRDGASDELLSDPDMWDTLVGSNQNVEYVD